MNLSVLTLRDACGGELLASAPKPDVHAQRPSHHPLLAFVGSASGQLESVIAKRRGVLTATFVGLG
jgi:hypothetical protein